MTTPAAPVLPPVMSASAPYLAREQSERGLPTNPCIVCAKNCPSGRKARHVQLTIWTEPVPYGSLDDEDPDNLGCFPVGPECAKRFPPEYVSELRPVEEG